MIGGLFDVQPRNCVCSRVEGSIFAVKPIGTFAKKSTELEQNGSIHLFVALVKKDNPKNCYSNIAEKRRLRLQVQ
jgi:hypothetical protein